VASSCISTGAGTLTGGRTRRASKSGGISAQGISVSERWAEFGIFLPLATYQAALSRLASQAWHKGCRCWEGGCTELENHKKPVRRRDVVGSCWSENAPEFG
jgi:hypothetical protein